MKTMSLRLVALLAVMALVFAACGDDDATTTEAPATTAAATTEAPATTAAATTTEAPTTTAAPATTEAPFEAPEGALVSVPADAPTLDGVADEAAWASAPSITVGVAGGANAGSHDVTVKSLYSGDMVYFLVAWDDATEDHLRSPWEKQADGTWKQQSNPADTGQGGNNTYYEDKMSIIWNIPASPIADFETVGCFVACHAGENNDTKAYGNKYTSNEGELGDIWHWKSVRNVAQLDDQYLDSMRWSEDTNGAGRHGDPNDGGGYYNNKTEDGLMPMYMLEGGGDKNGDPGYIRETDIVAFDDSLFVEGDLLPGVITAPFTGDRGDLDAGFVWADGVWTVEFSRQLVTGSEFDVQFDDMYGVYHFGVAIFDNAQTMHSFQTGVNQLVFKP